VLVSQKIYRPDNLTAVQRKSFGLAGVRLFHRPDDVPNHKVEKGEDSRNNYHLRNKILIDCVFAIIASQPQPARPLHVL